jgi:hypothetical protein
MAASVSHQPQGAAQGFNACVPRRAAAEKAQQGIAKVRSRALAQILSIVVDPAPVAHGPRRVEDEGLGGKLCVETVREPSVVIAEDWQGRLRYEPGEGIPSCMPFRIDDQESYVEGFHLTNESSESRPVRGEARAGRGIEHDGCQTVLSHKRLQVDHITLVVTENDIRDIGRCSLRS